MSNSQRPQGLQPTRLLCPWDSPGRSTGVRAIAGVIREPLTRVLRRGRVCKWIPRWCTAPRYSFCLPQADLRTPGVQNHVPWKETYVFILFYFFTFPSVCLDSLSTVGGGGKHSSQGWPRGSCHKPSFFLPFCGTCAKTAQDKRHFQFLVYFSLVVKEWKFRKEKPLEETVTAERAEQGRFWGAAL